MLHEEEEILDSGFLLILCIMIYSVATVCKLIHIRSYTEMPIMQT